MVQLALKLGKFTHEVEAIPLDEFLEFVAINNLDPWTEDRSDYRAAMIATVTNRTQGGKAKLDDFMPKFGPRKERSPEEMALMLKQFVQVHNARVKGGQTNGE